jgi:hypothetical protein
MMMFVVCQFDPLQISAFFREKKSQRRRTEEGKSLGVESGNDAHVCVFEEYLRFKVVL